MTARRKTSKKSGKGRGRASRDYQAAPTPRPAPGKCEVLGCPESVAAVVDFGGHTSGRCEHHTAVAMEISEAGGLGWSQRPA